MRKFLSVVLVVLVVFAPLVPATASALQFEGDLVRMARTIDEVLNLVEQAMAVTPEMAPQEMLYCNREALVSVAQYQVEQIPQKKRALYQEIRRAYRSCLEMVGMIDTKK